MLCKHCGKEIPENSKFCRYCGQAAEPQPICDEGKKGKLPLILAVLLVGVVSVLGVRQMKGASAQAAAISAASSTAASAPEPSEFEKKMTELQSHITYYTKAMIRKELSNPDSLKLIGDWNALTNRGVFITHSGTAEYLNRDGVQTAQPFKATMILNGNNSSAFFMALTLGDTILYDECNNLDETGKIIASNITFSGRGYGEQVFDEITNPDLWDKGAETTADATSLANLTLSDYQTIEMGMTYDQVCKILGSPGVELSRSGTGKKEEFTVIWNSETVFGASITVGFKGGKADSKIQLGLQ